MLLEPFIPPQFDEQDSRSKSFFICAHIALILAIVGLCVTVFFMGYTMNHVKNNLQIMVQLMQAVHADTKGMCYGMSLLSQSLGQPISNSTCS